MLGDSKVPANGFHTLLSGAIWVPSAVRVSVGFGRRYAVISSAFDSSIFSFPASSVGLFSGKRSLTFSHVHACCAQPGTHRPMPAKTREHFAIFLIIYRSVT